MTIAGGATVGYCATGNRVMAAMPSTTMKIAMTHAKMGRSMKNREFMVVLRRAAPRRTRPPRGAGSTRSDERGGSCCCSRDQFLLADAELAGADADAAAPDAGVLAADAGLQGTGLTGALGRI